MTKQAIYDQARKNLEHLIECGIESENLELFEGEEDAGEGGES